VKSKGKPGKKDSLKWEIIKLQAQLGESPSKKAKRIIGIQAHKQEHSANTDGDQDHEGSSQAAAERLQKLMETKISQKIYHAKVEVKRALAKAKTQETQRLVKRLRQARKSVEEKSSETNQEVPDSEKKKKDYNDFAAADVERFSNELEMVKKLDMDSLSEDVFTSKLSKHPILKSHALLAPYLAEKSKAAANDKSPSDPILDPLQQVIGSRLCNTTVVKDLLTKLWNELEYMNKKTKQSDDEDDDDSSADSDDDALGNEDVSMSDDQAEDDDGYDSDGLPLPMNGRSKTSSTTSMFIGALNDSDDKGKKKRGKNDYVDTKFDEIYGSTKKKNRPGQRERQKIAEQKYGKEANHVKKAEEEERSREEKRAARKAKKEAAKAKYGASDANAQRVSTHRSQAKKDAEPTDPTLHPSWIAKKSEAAAVAAALAGGKSNKIVFGDTD
ncbi:hypothetical protein BGW38_006926, partial [Lunasporangiospora selenospora]